MDLETLLEDLSVHGITAKNKQYLVNLMLTGTTHPLRKQVRYTQIWLELTGAAKQLRFNPNYYGLILGDANAQTSIFAEMIERDVNRTFPEEVCFQYGSAKETLRNVLVAYSWRNSNVGYCQGMNFIAARFISFGFREEEVFWLLCAVVESLLPIDYFSVMSGILIDQRVFGVLLNTSNPALKRHLESLNIDPSMFCVKWLACLFTNTLNKKTVIRIWDVFLVQGSELLFRAGLAILEEISIDLMAARTFDKAIYILSTGPARLTNAEQLLETANNLSNTVTLDLLNRIRDTLRPEALRFMESKSWSRNSSSPPSDMCSSDEDCKQRTQRSASFFVFNVGNAELMEDYFDKGEVAKYHFDEEPGTEPLMRGKKSHNCWMEVNLFHTHRPKLTYFQDGLTIPP